MVLYRVAKEVSKWSALERSTSCELPAGTSKQPMRHVEQLEGGVGPKQSTYLIGVMRDGKSVAIEFEWEDGQAERVDLVNGSFLVLREGVHRLEFFRGLDAEGTPVVGP
jgi:hypothetical protein